MSVITVAGIVVLVVVYVAVLLVVAFERYPGDGRRHRRDLPVGAA